MLGFIPKKERKKKHEALEEMRGRSHLDSVALNITVPSLALKASNGLDESPPSPPCSRLLPLPDGEHLDPFAFYEEDMEAEEGIPRKGSSVRKKPQSRLVLSQRLPPPPPPPPPLPHDADHLQPRSEHFSPSSVHPGPTPFLSSPPFPSDERRAIPCKAKVRHVWPNMAGAVEESGTRMGCIWPSWTPAGSLWELDGT